MNISELAFESKHSKASVERGIKFLEKTQRDLIKGNIRNNNGMYAKLGVDSRYDDKVLTGQCHLRIGNKLETSTPNVFEPCDLVATLTHRLDKYPSYKDMYKGRFDSYLNDPEAVERFTQWFTQQSMYSRFFVPMPLEFNTQYGLLISTDIPAQILQNMCIISRHTREKGPNIRLWIELVDKGVNPDIAYVISTNIIDHGPFGEIVTYGTNGHFVLPTKLSVKDAALRAVGGDLYGLEKLYTHYRTHASISGGSALFVTGGNIVDAYAFDHHWSIELRDKIKNRGNTSDKVVSIIPNPFKKRTSTDSNKYSIDRDHFFNDIVPLFIEEITSYLKVDTNVEEDNSVAA